jgi:hypothetical protein
MDVAGSEDPNLSYDWEESGGELPLVEWSVEDVCSWLEELGLVGYMLAYFVHIHRLTSAQTM